MQMIASVPDFPGLMGVFARGAVAKAKGTVHDLLWSDR